RGQLQHEAQELPSEAHRLRRAIDGETGQPERRHRIAGDLPPEALREVFDVDVARRDCDEAEDASAIHRNVGYPQIVPELVLARVPEEEAVQRFVARREGGTIVTRAERPNLHRASACGARAWAWLTSLCGASPRRSS